MKMINPDTVAAPLGAYTHAVAPEPGARWLVISGQVGSQPDGTIPGGIEAQAEWTWRNLLACLEADGMGPADIVKVNAFLLSPDDLPAYAKVRGRYLGDHRPASTLLFVSALVKPELLLEVEAIAARAR